MRQTPVLRDTARWGSHGRFSVAGLTVALAGLAIVRAIAVAPDFSYLALLSLLAAVALGACAVQLGRIDDALSWLLTSLLAGVVAIGHILVLIFGLPGSASARVTPATAAITVVALVTCVAATIGTRAALRRQQHPRTPPLARPVARVREETGSVRPARPSRAHPAA
jgi:hypothetical protein